MIYVSTHLVMATCFSVIVTSSINAKFFEGNSIKKLVKQDKSSLHMATISINNEKYARNHFFEFNSSGRKKVLFMIALCLLYVAGKHFKPGNDHEPFINPGTTLILRTK